MTFFVSSWRKFGENYFQFVQAKAFLVKEEAIACAEEWRSSGDYFAVIIRAGTDDSPPFWEWKQEERK